MNKEQLKEHIVNDIKELKQHIIAIEKSLQKFRISFLHHKYKEKDELKELVISFLQDLPNFIIIEIHNIRRISRNLWDNDICPKIDDALINTMIIADKQTERYMEFHLLSRCYPDIQKIMELDLKIEDLLINTMLIKEKKLKCYENIIKHYPEKTNIENIMELYPEKPEKPEKPEIKNKQYSISPYVIFLIMIVFYIITVTTVILLLNHNNSTTQLDHPIQCIMPTFKNTQFIDKHNKLKDLKKNLIIN